MDDFGYNSNPLLKKLGSKVNFTQYEIDELIKCKEDPVYFIEAYCKIVSLDSEDPVPFVLFKYQKKFIKLMHENRRAISMQPRQMGKTSVVAGYICWYVTFQQNQTVAILANKGDVSQEVLARMKFMYENLPTWMQHGIKKWNEKSVSLENGSKIITGATTKAGLRSRSCVSGDTKVCILDNQENIFYIEITKLINNKRFINIEENMQTYQYIIYKTTNNLNGHIYVGFHKTKNLNDGYIGSGRALRKAVEEFGIENFTREIIEIFDNKEDAEALEAYIVNEDFIRRNDVYNINLGGNIRPSFQTRIFDLVNDKIYFGYEEALRCLGFVKDDAYDFTYDIRQERLFLAELLRDGKIEIEKVSIKESLLKAYEKYRYMIDTEKERRFEISLLCSERRKDKKQSKEHSSKRGKAVKLWIENNPDKHKERMDKINRNPEKIRKTAAKHIGMKRNEEARKNISDSLKGKEPGNKGKIKYHNPVSNENIYISSDSIAPEGFVRGNNPNDNAIKRGILHNNGITQKLYKENEIIPEGWIKGGLPKPRKIQNTN